MLRPQGPAHIARAIRLAKPCLQEALCARGEIPQDLLKQIGGPDLVALMECQDLYDHLPTLIPNVIGARPRQSQR